MAPSGGVNGTPTSENSDGWETTKNEDKGKCDMGQGKKKRPSSVACNGGSDDETTSDPIVVSAETSPMPSQNSSVQDVGTEEIFQDAKAEAPSPVSATPSRPSPPSFVVAGLQKKASPLSLKSWTALALTLDGRDKITKVFQYASRMLAWWFAGTGSDHLSLRFGELYKSLANSRKAFRLGRSLIEIEKLRSMGLGELILWHLQRTLGLVDMDETDSSSCNRHAPRTLARRASSNIGWGPMSLEEEKHGDSARRHKPSLARSLSMKAYRAIYRPLRSTLSTVMGDVKAAPSADVWIVVGSALKMLGLLGFWAGDNINYISSTGFFDDHSLPTDQRLEKRKDLQTLSGIRANQAYFAGSVAGLVVTAYSYLCFRRDELAVAEEQWKEACEEGDEDETKHAHHRLQKVKEKQFSLFLAFLKSCCDVMVFSNNPGIDLHQKWRGKKNHEGLHCVMGLVSAGTVLYNNFPDA